VILIDLLILLFFSVNEIEYIFRKKNKVNNKMCIERIPPANLVNSGSFTGDVVEPDIIEMDYDIDELYYDIEYSNADESSDAIWNELDYEYLINEQEFDRLEIQKLEEQELVKECMEAMNEMILLDEIRQVEAEQHKE
jgi:hypothetical protein